MFFKKDEPSLPSIPYTAKFLIQTRLAYRPERACHERNKRINLLLNTLVISRDSLTCISSEPDLCGDPPA